jgi:thiosulfate dehydrogenase (quinone) large subunit
MDNPLIDIAHFLLRPGWLTPVFWLLVAGAIGIAIYAFVAIPGQRSFTHVWNFAFRLTIGVMWWQATLWKLPPLYTDEPGAFGETGLAFWMIRLGQSAALQVQANFVNQIVLPHFYLFAPIVYALEVLTAVSLILGLFVRFWAFIGALQALNLWLGLYNDYYNWPWTYFFLSALMLVFAVHRYGRSLGFDAVIAARASGKSRVTRIILAAA